MNTMTEMPAVEPATISSVCMPPSRRKRRATVHSNTNGTRAA